MSVSPNVQGSDAAPRPRVVDAGGRLRRAVQLRSMVRYAEWSARVFVACANCGLRATLEIFVFSRRSTRLRRVRIKGLGRAMSFRGRLDYGVMSHFYTASFRVRDPAGQARWIIDAGANIGDETVKFRAFNPLAHVVAIEADPANVAVLRLNADGDDHIHVEHKALWSKAGATLSLSRTSSPEGTSVHEGVSNGSSVTTTDFDELQAVYGIERFDVVKLDIEGAERHLLSDGNNAWLARTDIVIMEVADHENPAGLQRLLSAMPHEVDCQIIGESLVAVRRGCGLAVERYVFL